MANSINYAVYDLTTGAILRIGLCANNATAINHSYNPSLNEGFYTGAVSQGSYLPAGVLAALNEFIITASKNTLLSNGVDIISFTGIPAGSVCSVVVPTYATAPAKVTINDGVLVFKTYAAGNYTVQIDEPTHEVYTLNFQTS